MFNLIAFHTFFHKTYPSLVRQCRIAVKKVVFFLNAYHQLCSKNFDGSPLCYPNPTFCMTQRFQRLVSCSRNIICLLWFVYSSKSITESTLTGLLLLCTKAISYGLRYIYLPIPDPTAQKTISCFGGSISRFILIYCSQLICSQLISLNCQCLAQWPSPKTRLTQSCWPLPFSNQVCSQFRFD